MPEDLSAPLLLKLQARFFFNSTGYPVYPAMRLPGNFLRGLIWIHLNRKIFPLPFSSNFKLDFLKFYRISGISGNKIIRNFLRILIRIFPLPFSSNFKLVFLILPDIRFIR